MDYAFSDKEEDFLYEKENSVILIDLSIISDKCQSVITALHLILQIINTI